TSARGTTARLATRGLGCEVCRRLRRQHALRCGLRRQHLICGSEAPRIYACATAGAGRRRPRLANPPTTPAASTIPVTCGVHHALSPSAASIEDAPGTVSARHTPTEP